MGWLRLLLVHGVWGGVGCEGVGCGWVGWGRVGLGRVILGVGYGRGRVWLG